MHSILTIVMSDTKTKPTKESVKKFLDTVEHDGKRADSFKLLEIMKEITNEEPVMWGPSIVGFGSYHYKYKSGREGDWLKTGFSPRKQSLTVYIMEGFDGYEELLGKLGKHKTGVSCLYINKLTDVDMSVLRKIIKKSYQHMSSM